jgi:hypothetical protein
MLVLLCLRPSVSLSPMLVLLACICKLLSSLFSNVGVAELASIRASLLLQCVAVSLFSKAVLVFPAINHVPFHDADGWCSCVCHHWDHASGYLVCLPSVDIW